ncbi:hypothetical protein L3V82_00205 [Thiotrichales bacterium 19S3-7]|nr:hypothetical protein [Thiotrichales bacterium 19S3-7]MCF6800585.1 hypothetical protein [Thiotrichales bacterium 19S3-11]
MFMFKKVNLLISTTMLSLPVISHAFAEYPDGFQGNAGYGDYACFNINAYRCLDRSGCSVATSAPSTDNGWIDQGALAQCSSQPPTPPAQKNNYQFSIEDITGGIKASEVHGTVTVNLEDKNAKTIVYQGQKMMFNIQADEIINKPYQVCGLWWSSITQGESLAIEPITTTCSASPNQLVSALQPAKISVTYTQYHKQDSTDASLLLSKSNHQAFSQQALSIEPKLVSSPITYHLLSGGISGINYQLTVNNQSMTAKDIHYLTATVTDDTPITVSASYIQAPLKEIEINQKTSYPLTSDITDLSIEVKNKVLPDLTVKGWPSYFAMGTETVNSDYSKNLMLSRPSIDAIDKYAGPTGSSDTGNIIDPSQSASKVTIQTAQELTDKFQHPVIPVMVFYSANASGSWSNALTYDLQNNNNLQKHYINLILLAHYLEANPVELDHNKTYGSIILNPDFLGEAHKSSGLTTEQLQSLPVAVTSSIQYAVDYVKRIYGIDVNVPLDGLGNTLPGYIQSINRIINSVAPNVSFGWEDAVWAGQPSGHGWVHQAYRNPSLVDSIALGEANFLKALKVYDNKNKLDNPQYIAFDKYERDTIVDDIVLNPYLYNANDWSVYLKFVGNVSRNLNNIPVMLWQTPGAHMQSRSESDVTHGATAADYFLGDASLHNDLSSNLVSNLAQALNMPMADLSDYNIPSDEKNMTYLEYLSTKPTENLMSYDNYMASTTSQYNWSYGHLADLLENNVFAILWGGGSTTGIAGDGPGMNDGGFINDQIQSLKAQGKYYCLNGNRYSLTNGC